MYHHFARKRQLAKAALGGTAGELREIVATTFERIRTLLAAAFEQGIANGEFTAEVDPAELSETVLAVVQGAYVLDRSPLLAGTGRERTLAGGNAMSTAQLVMQYLTDLPADYDMGIIRERCAAAEAPSMTGRACPARRAAYGRSASTAPP